MYTQRKHPQTEMWLVDIHQCIIPWQYMENEWLVRSHVHPRCLRSNDTAVSNGFKLKCEWSIYINVLFLGSRWRTNDFPFACASSPSTFERFIASSPRRTMLNSFYRWNRFYNRKQNQSALYSHRCIYRSHWDFTIDITRARITSLYRVIR